MTEKAAATALPTWNLNDLYPGRDSPELARDFDRVAREAKDFRGRFEGKVGSLDGDGLGAAIEAYERIDETIGRIASYASLVFAGDMSDPEIAQFHQSTQERLNDISSDLIFFTLEINRIEDGRMATLLASDRLKTYAPWIRDTRVFRPHQLSDEIEHLLHERYIVGSAAWSRLFDETMADMRVTVGRKVLPIEGALNLLSDKDGKKRKAAAHALAQAFKRKIRLFALITNTLAKDKAIDDKQRGYSGPTAFRHLSNYVEEEVVEALASAVKSAYPRLSHRYYALKAKWFGVDKLNYWDRNAPLPGDSDRKVSWPQAKKIVLSAYGAFSPDMAEIAGEFFDKSWIDAPLRPGKAPGAFSASTVPSVHPYVLLNYQGRTRDVMTLAHELGHGVHQVLAGPQGALMSNTPLTLAETASVFGEMLTFQSLLKREKDPERRRLMLASKVEDMLNTVVRQIAFYEFEKRVHNERRNSELTPDQIGKHWMETHEASLGPAFRFDPEYQTYWSYIPHFIHSPFYVYAYAFGDCLVNSLYAVYQGAESGFQEKYLDLLKAGGTKRHKELLAPFGLDASDPAFWSKGLGVVESMIDQLAGE
jgi:oligoendopeptidase F